MSNAQVDLNAETRPSAFHVPGGPAQGGSVTAAEALYLYLRARYWTKMVD